MATPMINFNGQEIEFAQLGSYTMDEAMILYDYSKITLDQLAGGEITEFIPGLIAALIHVSVQRANPQRSTKEIRKAVGALKITDLEQVFNDLTVEVEDGSPPTKALTTEKSDGNVSATSSSGSSNAGEHSQDNSQAARSGRPGSELSATSVPTI